MDRSYLVEMVRSLDEKEVEELELFLESSYYSRSKSQAEAQILFQVIRASQQQENAEELSKEDVYRRIFGNDPWVNGRLEKLMAELNKLIRAFLLQRYYFREENEFEQQLDLARILQMKGLYNRQHQTLNRLRAGQERSPWKDADFFYRQFRLEHAEYEMESIYNQKKGDLNIPAVLRNLDIYYHLNQVNLLNHYLLQQKMAKVEFPEEMQDMVREYPVPISYLNDSSNLLIGLKIKRLLSSESPSLEDFNELTDLLPQHESRIEKAVLQQYSAYLRSLCVMLITEGYDFLLPVLHRLLKADLARGALYPPDQHGQLAPSTLMNIVSVSIRVQEFEWLDDFLESHRDRIIGDNESCDFYRMNKAAALFAQKKYDAALDLIPANSAYIDYHMAARRLEIKIYYETASDLLPYKLDAFKMFVSRASKKFLSDGLRKRNADFANFAYQLMQSTPGDMARAERLAQRIQEKKWTADREWLLEKAAELGQ